MWCYQIGKRAYVGFSKSLKWRDADFPMSMRLRFRCLSNLTSQRTCDVLDVLAVFQNLEVVRDRRGSVGFGKRLKQGPARKYHITCCGLLIT